MIFDYKDYMSAKIDYPRYFNSLESIDKHKMQQILKHSESNKLNVSTALDSVRKRVSGNYRAKMSEAQLSAINFAEHVFPAYKLLFPEVLVEDWLSLVDPHKDNCRDHSLHQPLTAYIVAKMLGYGNPANAFQLQNTDMLTWCGKAILENPQTRYLREYFQKLYPESYKIPRNILQKMSRDVFYEAAILSALFHDIGYPKQYVNRIENNISLSELFPLTNNINNAHYFLKHFGERLMAFPFYAYSTVSKSNPICIWGKEMEDVIDYAFRNTHSIPGAVMFTFLQDSIRKYPSDMNLNEAVLRFVYDWAAVGIMMHDFIKLYKERTYLRLSFGTDPLSCMIAWADTLEEFERPKAFFVPSDKSATYLGYHFPCKRTEMILDNNKLNIVYTFSDDKEMAKIMRFKEVEINEYFNKKTGFVKVSPLGIDEVYVKGVVKSGDDEQE